MTITLYGTYCMVDSLQLLKQFMRLYMVYMVVSNATHNSTILECTTTIFIRMYC